MVAIALHGRPWICMDLHGFAWIRHGSGMDLAMFGTVGVVGGGIWSRSAPTVLGRGRLEAVWGTGVIKF